ncbi:hypothetical protein GUJ93_ZPchr0008g12770 [Zizania palustris]|uniref:Nuclear transcription factor Y subunit n=1 Tax=Zizania palustris TaxID=103762 RepID=A0A8J5RBY8_ZIZPA|nr:hypothetical protein GUJ93_ZPchr0008g12770 [Zizania palustris]
MQLDSETQLRPTAAGHPYPGVATSSAGYVLPVGPATAQVAYPYIGTYYGSIYGAYSGQPLVNTTLLAMPPHSVCLATDAVLEPIYVNARQYHGILRRRQSRAKAESENKSNKTRKPYLHESRHLHALKRARGSGGRFLNTKTMEGKQDSKSVNKKDGGAVPSEYRHNKEINNNTKFSKYEATYLSGTKEGSAEKGLYSHWTQQIMTTWWSVFTAPVVQVATARPASALTVTRGDVSAANPCSLYLLILLA